MTRAALQALWSHWRAQPLQLASLLIGLALATALWTGVQAINAEAKATYARAAERLDLRAPARLLAKPGATLSMADFTALRRAGWLVSPVIEGNWQGLRLIGIDPLTSPTQFGAQDAPTSFDLAGFLTPPGFGLAPADVLATPPKGLPLRAATALPQGTVLTDISTAARLLERDDLSYLTLPDTAPDLPPWAQITPNLQLKEAQTAPDLARLTDSFHLNLTAFGLLAFVVGLFIVHSAIGLAFEQRRPLFRTLRALGVPLRQLIGLLALELIAFAMVAASLGIVLGYVIAAALLPGVAITLDGLYGAQIPDSLTLRGGWVLSGYAIAVLGTVMAGGQSLWRMHNMPMLSPAMPRAWLRHSMSDLRRQAALGLGLLAMAGACAWWGAGLLAGFAVLGMLLLGAALILPFVLSVGVTQAARHARGPVAQWVWSDTLQQIPGLSLALMALMLALAANIGVGTMVGSFRHTFTGWLDQRLAAEVYITAEDSAQGRDISAWLATRNATPLPIVSAQIPLGDAPGKVFGVADHATYHDHWPLLWSEPDAWAQLAAGTGLLVNEQLARRQSLTLGDTITLRPGTRLPIVGVYSDYGNPSGQAIIGFNLFRSLFPQTAPRRFAVRVPPDQAPQLITDLIQTFDLPPDDVVDQERIKAASLRVFEQTFAVTHALNLLTLGVAGVALLISLLTLSSIRLPQLAPVWAMGLTRRRLAQLEILRALGLSGLTFLVALPVGLALAWVLLAFVNVVAFGWRLPMAVFPGDWIVLAGLTGIVTLAAAIWPARRLSSGPPVDLLKVFASDH